MKRRFLTRTICFLICVLLFSSVLVSCGSNESDTTSTTDGGNGEVQEQTDVSEETSDPVLEPPELPEADYDGYTFTILTGTTTNPNVKWQQMAAEEQNGEPINDAIYTRNLAVEERFNVKIVESAQDSPDAALKKSVQAGDNNYDIAHITLSSAATLARGNLLFNFYDVPYISFDKPWWDQKLQEQLTISGKLYFHTGDITVYTNCRTACMYFNKGMFQKFELEYPYELVRKGEWTIDALLNLIKDVNLDIDGDGVMTQNDQWGFMSEYRNTVLMFHGSGERVVSKTADGGLELTMNTPRALEVINKVLNICTDDSTMFLADEIKGASDVWLEASNLFQQDKYLIRESLFEPIPRDLRNMPTDFGVLPYVKYDSSQKEYYSEVGSDGRCIAIPKTAADITRTGVITEALAYGSVDTLTKAFYDLSLTYKLLRDDESKEMLDIIFSTKVYDIGLIFNIGGYESILGDLTRTRKTDFVSAYEKALGKAQTALDKIIEDFSNAE